MFVLLLQALAPVVVRALPGQMQTAEICTALGVQTVQIAAQDGEPGDESATNHCPWCKLSDTAPLLPPPDSGARPVAGAGPPAAVQVPYRPLPTLRAAYPRGPPPSLA